MSWRIVILALAVHVVGGTVICLSIENIPILWFAVVGIAELRVVLWTIARIALMNRSPKTERA